MNHKKLIHRINLYEGMYRNGRTLGRAIEGTEEVLKEASAALTELEAKYELLARYAAKKYTQCEALEKENAQLRAELEHVKREREALLEYAKEQHECKMCENDTFCPHMAPTFEDCSLCNLECPCYLACEENDNWRWRGPQKEE